VKQNGQPFETPTHTPKLLLLLDVQHTHVVGLNTTHERSEIVGCKEFELVIRQCG
jgi:hypothetical protein